MPQRRSTAGPRRSGGADAPAAGVGGPGSEAVGFGGLAQGRAGENRPGMVVAGAHDRIAPLGWTNPGDGALYARDPGSQSDGPKTGQEIAAIETLPFQHRRNDRMKPHERHFSRTDPFTTSSSNNPTP